MRPYLQRLAQDRQVAILLDRRVDPSQRVPVAILDDYFDEGIRNFVKPARCEISMIGETLFVGPPETAAWLRTRVQILRDELDAVEELSPKRQFELLRRYELTWDDLATPREVLRTIGERYHFEFQNAEIIPHDLWVRGTIASPNVLEALTIVLTQYELTFEWINTNQIRLVEELPIPGLEREHRPRGMTIQSALQVIQQVFPALVIESSGPQLHVTGTLEQHEKIAELIGESPPRRPPPKSPATQSLRDRRLTLKMVRKPFGSLMATLQQQGIQVRYDATAIQNAQIDLGTLISLELEQATIDLLLEQACQKVGLTYSIENDVILLKVPQRHVIDPTEN